MFSDIEGFTGITERLPPAEVVAWLNEYFAAMTAVVYRHEGILDKYIGDAMLMVWKDESLERGARSAVLCALEMNKVLAVIQEKWMAEGKRPVKIRIGISSGPVIIGEIGGPQRRELTVIGDAVNTASRLEELNKNYQTDVILSGCTFERTGGLIEVRSLGIVPIKGRRDPIPIYALLGLKHGLD
ncbi:MAG TPA: hypothetical protein DD435_13975 [Cyanobacteria bacterium UBA8530]|nr:hypothetical protein [Cyanobacteria bacterium UBA8530]